MLVTYILAPAPIALPTDEFTMSWAYVWVAAGGLVLAFLLTAFIYLLSRRHGGRLRRTPALRSMERALSGHRWQVVTLVLSVGVGALVMHGLKWVFERSRPAEQVIGAAGHSFPSGHAFMATTLYGWMIYFTWRLLRQDAARILATVVLAVMIVMTGISRIVLRVHWASDVAGGITIGLAWLVCSLLLVRAVRSYFVTAQRIDDAAPN
jgi:membrane-associated phospholipid phosphatase